MFWTSSEVTQDRRGVPMVPMVHGARTISGSHGIREDPNAVGRGGRVAEVRGFLISEIERASWLFHRPDRDAVGIDHGGLKALRVQAVSG